MKNWINNFCNKVENLPEIDKVIIAFFIGAVISFAFILCYIAKH